MIKYDIRSGVRKIKTKTATTLSVGVLGLAGLGSSLAFIPALTHAATGYTRFGSATQQSNGVDLLSDNTTHPFSGVDLTLPAGVTNVSDLNNLSVSYQVIQGNCNVGSPRFSVVLPGVNQSIFVYLGDEPSFTNCASGASANLISDTDLRVDTSQLAGGTFYDTWAHAVTLVGSQPIQELAFVLDGGWSSTQEFLITSATVNTTAYSFVPVPTKDDCKNNGWQTMTDASNHHFKNQGDCVSYFATGGKNQAAGH